MHLHAVLSALHRGTPLAASVHSASADRLAWVGVYPLDLSKQLTQEFLRNQGFSILPKAGTAYRLRAFEVDRNLIRADESIGEQNLENQRSRIIFSDEELLRELEELGVRIESLELPYKSNYPI